MYLIFIRLFPFPIIYLFVGNYVEPTFSNFIEPTFNAFFVFSLSVLSNKLSSKFF